MVDKLWREKRDKNNNWLFSLVYNKWNIIFINIPLVKLINHILMNN